MTERYLLLTAAYAERDHLALMLFIIAAGLLAGDWALGYLPRIRTAYRVCILALWLFEIASAYFGGGLHL